jgi:hypothetical protein
VALIGEDEVDRQTDEQIDRLKLRRQ